MEKIKIGALPWVVPASIPFFESLINDSMAVIETGSGGSTVWLAERAGMVYSFEHTKRYYDAVSAELKRRGIPLGDAAGVVDLWYMPTYPKVGVPHIGVPLDLAFIDGRGRVKSIRSILPQIKSGGWIVLDNAERDKYQPGRKLLDKAASTVAIFKKGKWTTAFYKKR